MPPAPAPRAALQIARSGTPLLRVGVLLAGALALLPSSARADCVQVGMVVTCTANDPDGFGTGVEDGLDVTVQNGATVTPGAGVDGIGLDDDNTVTVESGGSITTNGAGADGIVADDGNTIVNGGAITTNGAGADGIQVGDDVSANPQSVTNGGVITVNGAGAGIRAGNGNTVTNNGTLTLSGAGSTGIVAGNGGTVVNTGAIAILPMGMDTGVDNVTGVQIGNGDADAMTTELRNAGGISLAAQNAGVSTVAIDAGDDNEIVNDSPINVSGDSANTIGVRLGSGNNFTNNSQILSNGDGARGVVTTGAGNTITNNSLIQTSPRQADMGMNGGPAVVLGGGSTIVNNGTIQGFGPNFTTTGVAIQGSGGADTVQNQGSIFGDVDLMGGDDVFDLRTGSSIGAATMLDGGADAAGDLFQLRGPGTGSLVLDQVMGFEQLVVDQDPAGSSGTWTLSGASTFTGGVMLNAGGLRADSTVGFAGATNFTMMPGTILVIGIDPLAGTAGRFDVGGTVTLAGTLAVAPSSPLVSGNFTVLSAAGGIAGTFATTPADTGILDFETVQVGNDIVLQVLRNSYASLGESPNQRAVGEYLDATLASQAFSPELGQLLQVFDALGAGQLPALLDNLHAEPYDAHTGQMARLGRLFAGVALEPRPWCKPSLYGLRHGQRPEVPCGPRGWSTWMRALAGFGDRDTGSDFHDSNHRDQGLLGGIDWRPTRNWVVSAWLGISSADIEVDDAGEGDLDTIEMGMAAVFRMRGARARAAFGYGRGDHQHDREVDLLGATSTAESQFDSNRIFGLLEVGWVFAFGNWLLEPLASLDVTWVQEEEIGESGAGALDLTVMERENTLVGTAFGGRVAYRHFQNPFSDRSPGWAQGTWTPELTARWRSTWTGADRELEARLQGAPASLGDFTAEAQDSEQGADIGAHLTFQPHGSGGSMSIGYDGYFGDGGMNHSFGAKLRLFF